MHMLQGIALHIFEVASKYHREWLGELQSQLPSKGVGQERLTPAWTGRQQHEKVAWQAVIAACSRRTVVQGVAFVVLGEVPFPFVHSRVQGGEPLALRCEVASRRCGRHRRNNLNYFASTLLLWEGCGACAPRIILGSHWVRSLPVSDTTSFYPILIHDA